MRLQLHPRAINVISTLWVSHNGKYLKNYRYRLSSDKANIDTDSEYRSITRIAIVQTKLKANVLRGLENTI